MTSNHSQQPFIPSVSYITLLVALVVGILGMHQLPGHHAATSVAAARSAPTHEAADAGAAGHTGHHAVHPTRAAELHTTSASRHPVAGERAGGDSGCDRGTRTMCEALRVQGAGFAPPALIAILDHRQTYSAEPTGVGAQAGDSERAPPDLHMLSILRI